MNDLLQLETERLMLRLSHPEDAQRVLDFRLRNREFLRPWLPAQKDEAFTLETTQNFLQEEWSEFEAGRGFRFLGFLKGQTEEIIVDFRFSGVIRGAFQSCFLGYLQDEAHCGNGYMQEALAKGIWYMFALEQLHRIEANIMPHNTPSIKLVERLGFQKEGHSPRYLNINGAWEDHDRYAILNE